MAIPTSIQTLLEGTVVEHARVEFKETWDPAASLKTVCAFANDIDNWGGGYIVIGVRDNGGRCEPIGVAPEKVDAYLKDMLNKCKLIRPSYMPIVDVASHEGMTFVILWCPGGNVRPYSSPKSMAKDCRERVNYIRKMASTVEPSDAELRDLYALANNVPFDDRPHHGANLGDLDVTLIKEFLNEVGSDLYVQADSIPFVELCRRMNIVDGPDEFLEPKNVGLMFFSADPARFFPCAQIDVVEFPEGLGGARIVEHTFTGPLHRQLRDALQYLRNVVVEEQVVKVDEQAEAERYFNYPYAAIEEALANAVYHKGYDVREPVEVRVLPDRIEIISHPGADRSISAEGLKHYRAISRIYRNRRVGDFLKELRLTEGRNTGMAKILRAMRSNGSPDPVFETDTERLYFIVTLGIHPAFLAKKDTGARRGKNSERRPATKPSLEKRLLDYLTYNPTATLGRMAHDLGVSESTVQRQVNALKYEGRLRREGTTRSGHWVIS